MPKLAALLTRPDLPGVVGYRALNAHFLLVGYILKMLDPAQTFAQAMITTGWVFGAVTAVAILVAATGLLLTALRNRPSPETGPYGELSGELAQAREQAAKAGGAQGRVDDAAARLAESRAQLAD